MEDLDCVELSKIVGKPSKNIRDIYNTWLKKKKRPAFPDQELIANFAGVSKVSVSNFFNKKVSSLSKQTIERIDKISNLLGYVNNQGTKFLKSREKKIVALIISLSHGKSLDFHINILKGIREEAEKYDYDIYIYDVDIQQHDSFFSKSSFCGMVDGVIIVASNVHESNFRLMKRYNIPVLLIHPRNRFDIEPVVGTIVSNTEAYQQLLEKVKKECYKKPTLVSIDDKNFAEQKEKINLFQKKFPHRKDNILFLDDYGIRCSDTVISNLLDKEFNTDIFICLSDTVAMVMQEKLRKKRIDIPVTGYDNIDVSHLFSITTIDQQFEKMGVFSFQRLFLAIQIMKQQEKFMDFEECFFPTSLIIRNSYS